MPTHQAYYPARQGDQITWLKNWRSKIGNYQTAGGYLAGDITATMADADFCIILLEYWLGYQVSFGQGATAYVNLILNGPLATATVAVPVFTGNPPSGGSPGPGVPIWPALVPPGALLRIFAFIAILKKKTFYNDQVGQDLQVIGAAASFDPAAVPPVKAEVKSGEVVLRFKKRAATESKGHQGVWVEGQVGAATAWTFLAIDTTDPYNDTRPLAVAGVPEKRRYRLCFWDGDPTNVWTDVIEVLFGG